MERSITCTQRVWHTLYKYSGKTAPKMDNQFVSFDAAVICIIEIELAENINACDGTFFLLSTLRLNYSRNALELILVLR